MSPSLQPAYDKQVGHWRISKDVFGSGTTSTVLRATHAKLPTLCAAVKIISRSGLLVKAKADPTALVLVDAVIHREVVLMKLAQHERVVRLYDFISRGDLVYIVMEHAPQKTLFDLFRDSPSHLPRSLVIHIFWQLVQGLAYTHALRIVHRDLKLENIFMFGPDPKALLREKNANAYLALNIKIGDFGLAHVDDPARLSKVFHGSPHYQAPELWLRVPHRPLPTDVWSAGIVLYTLLCRRLPFDLATLQNMSISADSFQMHVGKHEGYDGGAARFVSSRVVNQYLPYDVTEFIHPAANNLLRKIFAYDPSARPTAQEMLWDNFFGGLPGIQESTVAHDQSALVMHPRVDHYDLATLCMPPGRHISRNAFAGSSIETAIHRELKDSSSMERFWAQKLSAYEMSKDTWEADVAAQVAENQRKKFTRSLGRKNKAVDALGHTEATLESLTIPRLKLKGSFSFNNLRVMVTPKPPNGSEHVPHKTFQRISSSVASTLQDRREALLSRAYELGFGTDDLRAFADEAGAIVRVAREGNWQMGLEDIAREVERRGVDNHSGSRQDTFDLFERGAYACASAATTLVSENVQRSKYKRNQ